MGGDNLIEILRKILPPRIREKIGMLMDKYPLLFLPLMWIIFRMFIIPLFDGKFLIISPLQKIKLKVRDKGWIIYQEIFRDNIYERRYKVKRGDVVIDVGANVGIFTLKVAKTVGRSGLCIAIEPEPINFKLLEENTKQYNNVVRLQEAVGDAEGYVKLYLAETSVGHSIKKDYGLGHITVKMETLDRIVERFNIKKVDFIKIDTEGCEFEVLKGSKKILSLFGPNLALECHSTQDLHKILNYLKHFGYEYEVVSSESEFYPELKLIYAWRRQ